MPTLMERVTEFFRPKKAYQQNSATQGTAASPATPRAKKPAPKKAAARKPAAKKASSAKPATRGKAKTREQLYKEATRLKISGRTKMSKAQLERAVAKAKK